MPSETLPNKREVMLALLAEASVFIHLDPRGASVRVPPWFKNQAQLVLQVGLNMPVPIPDLEVGEQGITCTLSFSRRPFYCSIPWPSVFGLVGEGGPGLVWPDDVPVEVAAQVQAQGQKQPAKKGDARDGSGKDAARPRLRAVGSEPPPERQEQRDLAASGSDTPGSDTPGSDTPGSDTPDSVATQSESTAPVRAVPQASPAVVAAPPPTPEAMPALASPAEVTDAHEGTAQETSESSPGGTTPSAKPTGPKAKGKRELPAYLRVVK